MGMPPQLARAKRRRPRHSQSRPIVELLPHININDLCRLDAFPSQYDCNARHHLQQPFKYPFVKTLVISLQNIEFNHYSGYNQRIALHWVRTGFGLPRPLFVCQCGYSVRRLFFRYGHLACRQCHKAIYASQQRDSNGRKRLAASKLRLTQLGSLPDINEPFPPKPKWKHHRTFYKARKQLDILEAPIKAHRFKKSLSTQLFASVVARGDEKAANKVSPWG
jgi:hypothetical protein